MFDPVSLMLPFFNIRLPCFGYAGSYSTTTIFLESSQAMIKGLLSEASHTLESGNSNKTVENLLMVQRLVAQTNNNSTSIQDSMLLIRETVGAILSGRLDIAKANLNLINKQLIKQTPSNETSKTIPSNESTVTK